MRASPSTLNVKYFQIGESSDLIDLDDFETARDSPDPLDEVVNAALIPLDENDVEDTPDQQGNKPEDAAITFSNSSTSNSKLVNFGRPSSDDKEGIPAIGGLPAIEPRSVVDELHFS